MLRRRSIKYLVYDLQIPALILKKYVFYVFRRPICIKYLAPRGYSATQPPDMIDRKRCIVG